MYFLDLIGIHEVSVNALITPLPARSWGETCWRYTLGDGYAVCASEERGQDLTSDSVKPLPEDQCQTWWHKQHPSPTPAVWTLLPTCPFQARYHSGDWWKDRTPAWQSESDTRERWPKWVPGREDAPPHHLFSLLCSALQSFNSQWYSWEQMLHTPQQGMGKNLLSQQWVTLSDFLRWFS